VCKHHGVSLLAAQRTADAVLARPDYFAGQIAAGARESIRADKAHALGVQPAQVQVRATGHIQSAVLAHSIAIHKMRAGAIQAGLCLLDFRKAMWAKQNAARKAASDARRRQHRHGLQLAQAPIGQTTPARARQAGTAMALATAVLGPLPNPIVSIVLLPPGSRTTARGEPVDAHRQAPARHAQGLPGAAPAQTRRRSPRLAASAPSSSAGRPTLGSVASAAGVGCPTIPA
jgi:hypothetical protein